MVTCSRIPAHWRKSWTVWVRVTVRYWKCDFATNDPARAVEAACDRGPESLVMPPGESPIMARGRCHRNSS